MVARSAQHDATVGTFPISVLAERSGTGIPTIHHYRRIGLLPPALEVASNRFLYSERHVEALSLIRLLRERRNLPLDAIKEILPELLALGRGDNEPLSWDRVVLAYLERAGPGKVERRLIEAARTLFAERGYAAVSVNDLCARAKVAKGSFYRYFDSKEAVLLAAARSTVESVGAQLDQLDAHLSERQAMEQLQALMRPVAPLLLEVATGELLHQPAAVGVMGLIVTGLASRLMPRLITKSTAAARRAVNGAVVGLLRPALPASG